MTDTKRDKTERRGSGSITLVNKDFNDWIEKNKGDRLELTNGKNTLLK